MVCRAGCDLTIFFADPERHMLSVGFRQVVSGTSMQDDAALERFCLDLLSKRTPFRGTLYHLLSLGVDVTS